MPIMYGMVVILSTCGIKNAQNFQTFELSYGLDKQFITCMVIVRHAQAVRASLSECTHKHFSS